MNVSRTTLAVFAVLLIASAGILFQQLRAYTHAKDEAIANLEEAEALAEKVRRVGQNRTHLEQEQSEVRARLDLALELMPTELGSETFASSVLGTAKEAGLTISHDDTRVTRDGFYDSSTLTFTVDANANAADELIALVNENTTRFVKWEKEEEEAALRLNAIIYSLHRAPERHQAENTMKRLCKLGPSHVWLWPLERKIHDIRDSVADQCRFLEAASDDLDALVAFEESRREIEVFDQLLASIGADPRPE